MQRTSSDLRLNPHLHVVFLDGTYAERDGELAWTPLGHLKTSEVGEGLERALRRIDKHLRRHGLLEHDEDGDDDTDPEDALAASAVSGQVPPAGPQWTRRLARSGEHLLVDVVDDGVGIQRDAVARSASGLEHLRARAAGLAAELTVEATKEGRGTTVRLRIPWPTDATGERRCRGERARPATVRSGSV